jgi:hypothetical protein
MSTPITEKTNEPQPSEGTRDVLHLRPMPEDLRTHEEEDFISHSPPPFQPGPEVENIHKFKYSLPKFRDLEKNFE